MSRRGMRSRGFLAKRPGLRVYLDYIKDDPCVWCGGVATTVEHIVPQSVWDHGVHGTKRTGPHHWSNMAMSCRGCNSRRAAMSLLWFMVRLHARASQGAAR